MFLAHIGTAGLLQPLPNETHALGLFEVPSKRTLCTTIVRDLNGTNKAKLAQPLLAPAHLHWCMEAIGATFGLPIESVADVELMSEAADIYERWLGLANTGGRFGRPPCIGADGGSVFLSKACDHLSLLFEDRTLNGAVQPMLVEKHIALCRRALNILLGFTKEYREALDTATWERLLCVVVGIADYLLAKPIGTSVVADELQYQLIRVLFSIWLRSQSQNGALWDTLQRLVRGWLHRLSLIQQWNAVAFALTQRMLRVLWPNEGVKKFVISWCDNEVDAPVLAQSHALYAWYRVFHLLGRACDMLDSRVHSEYLLGVSGLVDTMLSIGRRQVDPTSTPSGAMSPTSEKTPVRSKSRLAAVALAASAVVRTTSTGSEDSKDPTDRSAALSAAASGAADASADTLQFSGSGLVQREFCRIHSQSLPQKASSATQAVAGTINPVLKAAEIAVNAVPPPPPDTNDLCRLFGAVLFDAALNEHVGFEYGRACAIGALGRMFTADSGRNTKVRKPYLARFYLSLVKALAGGEARAVAAVMCNCCGIFTMNLPGARVLVPEFREQLLAILSLGSVKQNVPRKTDTGAAGGAAGAAAAAQKERLAYELDEKGVVRAYGGIPVHLLRRACVIMLASLVCVPNTFEKIDNVGLFFSSRTDHSISRRARLPSGSAKLASEASSASSPTPDSADSAIAASQLVDGSDDTSIDAQLADVTAECQQALGPVGKSLSGFINIVLVEALGRETDEITLQWVLWTLCCKVLEDAEASPGIPQIAISTINRLLMQQQSAGSAWPPSVMTVALICLRYWSGLAEVIHLSSTATIPLMLRRVSQFVKDLQNAPPRGMNRKVANRLIVEALLTLTAWVVGAPWVTLDADCTESMLSVAHEVGAAFAGANSEPSAAMAKNAAQRLQDHLLFQAGRIPVENTLPWSLSSLVSEAVALRHGAEFAKSGRALPEDVLSVTGRRVRYFAVQCHTLITLIEHTHGKADNANRDVDGRVTVILRTALGRHMWLADRRFSHSQTDVADVAGSRVPAAPSEPVVLAEVPPPAERADPLAKLFADCEDELSHHMYADSIQEAATGALSASAGLAVDTPETSDGQKQLYRAFETLLATQSAMESRLSVRHADSEPDIILTPAQTAVASASTATVVDPYRGDHLFQEARQIFASLGLVELGHAAGVHEIRSDAELVSGLRNLDAMPTRHSMMFVVEYLSVKEAAGTDVMGISRGADGIGAHDADFCNFLAGLGRWINVDEHTGYSDCMTRFNVSGDVLYWSSFAEEMVFIAPALVVDAGGSADPRTCLSLEDLEHISTECDIKILWNTGSARYTPGSVMWSSYQLPTSAFMIIIDVMDCGLYHIRVCVDGDAAKIQTLMLGPLVTGTVVGRRQLAPLVRLTAMNIWKALQSGADKTAFDETSPVNDRRKALKDIIQSHKNMLSPAGALRSMVTSGYRS